MSEEERWRELCERASKEQDPKKLHELVKEIDQLLKEKEDGVKPITPQTPSKPK